jgi:hypothetical protein
MSVPSADFRFDCRNFPTSQNSSSKQKLTGENKKNMKNKVFVAITISALALGMFGCNASVSVDTNTPNAAKPANANANAASNASSNANSNTTSNAAKKDDKPKAALKDEKRPEGESKKVKNNPVPDSWVYVYDETKGYGFSVPEGTTGGSETVDGVDTFVAATPAPSELGIVVIAFKDKTLTKDDLLAVAVKFLEEMGETVTPGKLTAESEDYSVAEVTTASKDGGKGKGKILVGTDVTDNYVMLIGTDEAKYAANEKIIDEIWGSFEMWSGGASGKN